MKMMFFILTLTLTLTCGSQLEAQRSEKTVDSCPLSVDYYENQIRIADSLYKNYLPQYNYEEVKTAVMFFDSCQPSAVSRQRRGLFNKKATDENILIAESRLLTAAKAHYYHAVGLTERDNIVGACEHYFMALEIMEEMMEKDKRLKAKDERSQGHKAQSPKESVDFCPLSVDNKEDYEKIRFLSLINTRLGELFYSENYCDLAISKYRKALKYNILLKEKHPVAINYKCLGNSYQLYNMPDSALYYYNKSLETSSDLTNRLDVEKCIAQILFDKGEKDSAYIMIKSNLDKIENYGAKDYYYAVLGDMYYNDKEYDSACHYFNKIINNKNIYTKHLLSKRLSSIYDSLGDYEKKMYYNKISFELLEKNMNNSVEKGKLQSIYGNYNKKRQNKNDELKKLQTRRIIGLIILSFIISTSAIFIILKRREKLASKKHLDSLKEKDQNLADKENRINQISNEIKQKETEIERRLKEIESLNNNIAILKDEIEANRQEISDKEAAIATQKKELAKLSRDKQRKSKDISLENFYNSDICIKITSRKSSTFTVLTEEELALLLEAADKHLGNMTKTLVEKYPRLRKEDLNCICLILLNINTGRLHYLLGRNRKTVWERINRIKNIMNIKENKDLFLYIKDVLIK